MTMTSRTSKKLRSLEQGIRPSLSSREIQAVIFPQQSHLNTKTGKVVWMYSEPYYFYVNNIYIEAKNYLAATNSLSCPTYKDEVSVGFIVGTLQCEK